MRLSAAANNAPLYASSSDSDPQGASAFGHVAQVHQVAAAARPPASYGAVVQTGSSAPAAINSRAGDYVQLSSSDNDADVIDEREQRRRRRRAHNQLRAEVDYARANDAAAQLMPSPRAVNIIDDHFAHPASYTNTAVDYVTEEQASSGRARADSPAQCEAITEDNLNPSNDTSVALVDDEAAAAVNQNPDVQIVRSKTRSAQGQGQTSSTDSGGGNHPVDQSQPEERSERKKSKKNRKKKKRKNDGEIV